MFRKPILVALAAVALMATPALAQNKDKPSLREYCDELAIQFKAADTTHVSAEKLRVAKEQAIRGQTQCEVNPRAGAWMLTTALLDIGSSPK